MNIFINRKDFLVFFCLLCAFVLASCSAKPVSIDTKQNVAQSPAIVQNSNNAQVPIQKTEIAKTTETIKAKSSPHSVNLSVRKIDGYFLKSGAQLTENINFFILNSNTQFDDKVGLSQIKKPTSRISYDKSIVVIIALKPSNYKSDINISRVEYDDSLITVYFSTSSILPKLYYFANALAVFEIERKNPITTVNFISDKFKKEVLFGMRNRNSPPTLDALKNSYIGIYKGILPSVDLEDMSIILEINKNSTYILKEIRSDVGKVFETRGKWIPTDDLSSIVLNSDKEKSEHIFLYFIDKNTLEFFDAYGDKKTKKEYRLKK